VQLVWPVHARSNRRWSRTLEDVEMDAFLRAGGGNAGEDGTSA